MSVTCVALFKDNIAPLANQLVKNIVKFPNCLDSPEGNVVKATSILHKALTMNARPTHHLELAIRNLKAGEKRLVPTMEEEDDDDEEEEKPSGTV